MAAITTKWILELIEKATKPLRQITRGEKEAQEQADKLGGSLDRVSAIDLYAVTQALDTVNNVLNKAVEPALKYEDGLADVEAITGVTGGALQDLGKRARRSATIFGGEATDSLNTYKKILSQLGPAIAENPDALEAMEHKARTLSKTMDNDLVAATEALNTSMLQYQVDLSDATKASAEMDRMMNVMAAGAKEGAAEVPDVAAAVKVAGVQAYNSNVSFEELNASIQELARGGKIGAEGGTALRNVLGKMAGEEVISKEARDRLKKLGVDMGIVGDKSLPLTARLRELKKAEGDATIFAQMFGVENEAAARILIRSADAQDKLREKITGTNTAYEQAEIKMSTWTETMGRYKAMFQNVLITIGGSAKYLVPAMQLFVGLGQSVATYGTIKQGLLPVMTAFRKGLAMNSRNAIRAAMSFVGLTTSTTAMATAQGAATATSWTLSAGIKAIGTAIYSIPIVGWILAAITALVALFTYLWKQSAVFRGTIKGIWEIVKVVFSAIWDFVKPLLVLWWETTKAHLQFMWNLVKNVFGWIYNTIKGNLQRAWNTIKTVFNAVWGFLKRTLGVIFRLFKTVFGGVYDWVAGVFDRIWEKVKGIIEAIKKAVQGVGRFFGKLFGGAKNIIDEKIAEEREKDEKKKNQNGQGETNPINELLAGDTQTENSKTSTTGGTTSGSGDSGMEMSGNGGGAKNISLTINNHFNVGANADARYVADVVSGKIADRLQDAIVMSS
ncbi:phage tail tape measure protein [Sinomicrobium kalidii]|uniref:phage tail tape measure protein n=1 Tax=Sinomicrobium kalidii TaxID=2900738 RepID=UPI001E5EA8FF|nr:phage tail tape measure protein [Sinomicrobium kalidii]UGU15215.1 phage tail tape measure protein [Sinomicrobium kalidii]